MSAIDFSVTDDWGAGFVGAITIRAASGLDGWRLEFDAPFAISSIWNAEIVSHVGSHYVVRNAPWNGGVGAGQSVSFGFQAGPGNVTGGPTSYALNGETIVPTPEALPEISVDNISLAEGDSGTRTAVFTLRLSEASATPVTVAFATANGTATAGSDYVSRSGSVTFAAGETSRTVAVTVKGDAVIEGNEAFILNLSGASGAVIADGTGQAKIINDDGPTLSIRDASVAEGDSGTRLLNFTVTLSEASVGPVSVDFRTVGLSATEGTDYLGAAGTLRFAAGETSKTIAVQVRGDTAVEGNEAFKLHLSNAKGASLFDRDGIGRIVNDDTPPSLGIADRRVGEGDPSGTAPGFFSTEGNQIVDSAGNPVKIAGVNWFGAESETFAPHGLWTRGYKDMMDQMAELGFNTIRLPFSNEMFDPGRVPNGIDFSKNPDLQGLTGLQIFDKIVDYADEIGLRIILDHHRSALGAGPNASGLWYEGAYGEARWIADWAMLADRYAGNPTVIGADLHNEPHGPATWGGGGATDWAAAAERAGNAIHAVNDDWLIFVEGVETYQGMSYWWGGNLMGVADRPVELDTPGKLVYSPHDYPNSVYPQAFFSDPNFPANMPAKFTEMWGYIFESGEAPVYLGEFGSRLQDPKDIAWLNKLQAYLGGDFDADGDRDLAAGKEGIGWSWWSWNPNSTDTGGILGDDWRTALPAKVDRLEPMMFDWSEGSSTTEIAVTVTLSEAATGPVTVHYKTIDSNATAGEDYVAEEGVLTFAAGQRTKTITLDLLADELSEGNEAFYVRLSGAGGAIITDAKAVVVIVDDDAAARQAEASGADFLL